MRYRAHLVAEGRLAPRTINKYLLVLHAIFRRAQRHFGLTSNPVASASGRSLAPTTASATSSICSCCGS
jgi:hypothetical protein